MIQNFKEDYESPIPVVRFYFRRVMCTLISMLRDVADDALILDFGCGRRYFEKVSGFKNVVGYDVIPEFSDTSDYRSLRPEIILCNHSLEHLSLEDLKNVLDDFKKMNPRFIITGIPTQNVISRICAAVGKPHGYFEHKITIKEIHKELGKRFDLLSRKTVMTLTVVSKWIC